MNTGTNVARRGHPAASRRSHAGATAPAIPRRVSGPVARPASSAPAAVPARAPRHQPGLLAGAAALSDHRLLTRLSRGRLWIWCIALALGGIVAMQVSLLKLNTGISRAVQTSATLEMQNASLQAGIARLSAQERIQKEVTALGMQIPEAGDLEHVRVRGERDGRRAAGRMTAPSDQARERLALARAGGEPGALGASSAPSTGTAGAVTGAPVTAVAGVAPTAPPAPAAATATPPVAPAPVAPVAAAPVTVVPQG